MRSETKLQDMNKPLAIDLFCGKGGWSFGLIAAGWRVIGFDIERHADYPGDLVLQDVATLDGRHFRGKVDLIVARPVSRGCLYDAVLLHAGRETREENKFAG